MPHSEKSRIVILSLIDFPNGLGNTMRVKMLAKAFQHIGYRVSILIPYAAGHAHEGSNQEVRGVYEGIEFIYCSGSTRRPTGYLSLFYYKTFGILLVLRELWKLSRRCRIDYLYIYGVHGTTILEDVSYFTFGRFLGTHFIVDVNDTNEKPMTTRADVPLLRYLCARVKSVFVRLKGNYPITHSDCLFYVSTYLREQVEHLKRPSAKMLFVPTLIDSMATKGIVSKPLDNSKLIIYAGHFREFEGLDFLLEVLQYLEILCANFVCRIYGRTPDNTYQAERLQQTINRLGLQNHVLICDVVLHDQLFSTLSNGHVLVVPRRSNVITLAGFSQKFGDYLLSGVPVVSTKVGEIVNLLEDGKEIVFTPAGDVQAFAEAIYNLFTDATKAREIGRSGQQFAIEHFDYRSVARQIEMTLRQMT